MCVGVEGFLGVFFVVVSRFRVGRGRVELVG